MAGFFGFFNYEKEGPGISKNAPKKKTFIVFFETFFRNFWKFITVNVVYNILSLLVVTNGLAVAGMTNVTRNIARDKHSFGLSDFFETIKKNWKQATLAGIINVILYAVMIFDVFFFYKQKSSLYTTFCLGVTFSLLLIFTLMNYYIWTMMITFKFKLKQIYLNSFKFVFINFKNNFICFISMLLVYAIYIGLFLISGKYWIYALTLEIILFTLTLPAFRYLLIQFCTFPAIKKFIIDPYYKEHPDEDIEKRQNLGIEVEIKKPEKKEGEDGEEEEPENVFTD